MHLHEKRRFTIGRLMGLIAVLACLLAVPRLVMSPDLIVAAGLVAVLAGLLALNRLAEMVFGLPCPACARWSLHRLARHRGYYRCSACRARLRRIGFGPWRDASGPEDASKFQRSPENGAWRGFQIPENPGETTSGLLLRNKRQRNPPDRDD